MKKQSDDQTEYEFATEVRHLSVLMEQVIAQNQLVLETVGDMQEKVDLIPAMQEDIQTLKADMKIVKAPITDTNKGLHALDTRVARLEAAS